MYTAHFPRLHPSDFRVQNAGRRRRRLAGRLRHAGAVLRRERPHDGRLRPGRRSRLSAAQQPPMPPLPLGKIRRAARQGDEQARLALVAVGHRDRHHRVRRPRAAASISATARRLRAGRQGQHRHHLLAARHPRRRRTAHALPGARDHHRTSTAWRRASSTTTPTAWSSSSRPKSSSFACNGIGTPRLLLNSASARFPNGLANSSGLVGKNLMFHPYAAGLRLCRRARSTAIARRRLPVEQGVLRDRSVARLRPRLHASVRPRRRPGHRSDRQRGAGPAAVGRRPSRGLSPAERSPHRPARRSARTCRRSITASRSTRC